MSARYWRTWRRISGWDTRMTVAVAPRSPADIDADGAVPNASPTTVLQAGVDRMMTSKLMRALEKRDLVTRRAHETDARAVRVALTAAGRVLVEQATGVAREVDTMFFGADTATFRATLRGIAEHRSAHDLECR